MGPQGVRVNDSGIFARVSKENRQKFREEAYDGVDFKWELFFFLLFLQEAPLGSEQIKN